MSPSKKGLLALMRDLMAHRPRHEERYGADGQGPAASRANGWVTTRTFDLATDSGDAHWTLVTAPRMPKVQRFGG